ncbi:MAG: hypothetical protein FD122_2676 [Stygiobacter sp.]|nr:MAG: hypothetical protein FD122_2676 [Stygiobacter sp.]KAF0215211.1 MAG: hypothetical protein FD178_1850 [Ignavibacteria bacterium]
MEIGETYFKLYRKIFNNGLWKNPIEFRLFLWILGNAVYRKDGVNMGMVKVKRGQYLRSLRKLSEDLAYIHNRQILHYSISQIHRSIKHLEQMQIIVVVETQLGTLFTVLNYDKYQPLLNEITTSSTEETTGIEELGTQLGTTEEQLENNTNKGNKGNNVKTKDNIYQLFPSSLHPLQNYIKDSCPRVAKLEKQLTFEEAEILQKDFSGEIIKETLLSMENYSKLKNYTSVNLTLRNWLTRKNGTNKSEKRNGFTPKVESEQQFSKLYN